MKKKEINYKNILRDDIVSLVNVNNGSSYQLKNCFLLVVLCCEKT